MELPHEYWGERTLLEIAGGIGTPLTIDTDTQNRVFGHYARVLVDIDFSRCILDGIMVDRDDFAFKLEVVYEWLPNLMVRLLVMMLWIVDGGTLRRLLKRYTVVKH